MIYKFGLLFFMLLYLLSPVHTCISPVLLPSKYVKAKLSSDPKQLSVDDKILIEEFQQDLNYFNIVTKRITCVGIKDPLINQDKIHREIQSILIEKWENN